MTRLPIGAVAAATMLLFALTRSAQSQQVRWRVLAGGSAAILYADDQGDGTYGLGVGLGVERELRAGLAIRLSTNVLRSRRTPNNVIACPALPPCSVAAFPAWQITIDAQGLVPIYPRSPVRLVVGLGATVPVGGREDWRGSPPADSTASVRPTLRLGGEARLGRSVLAPRVQLTRSLFTRSIYSVSWVDALGLLFPLPW